MNIKDVWKVFKSSGMQDNDMQAMFRRHATPNACIELLEELEKIGELDNAKGIEYHLKALELILKRDLPFNAVSACVFINSEGVRFSYKTKSSDQLKRSGISMRNINGEFI